MFWFDLSYESMTYLFICTCFSNIYWLPKHAISNHTGAILGAVLARVIFRCLNVMIHMLARRDLSNIWIFLQADKVTVIFPMRFKDSIDTVLATSFLQVHGLTLGIYSSMNLFQFHLLCFVLTVNNQYAPFPQASGMIDDWNRTDILNTHVVNVKPLFFSSLCSFLLVGSCIFRWRLMPN